jgi:hypothetical protein
VATGSRGHERTQATMATNPWFASRTLAFVEGDRTLKMNRARRAIGFSVLVMLLALGTGWMVERAIRGSHALGGAEIRGSHSRAATGEPTKPNDAVRPAASDQEYDRSNLILSQG